MASPNDYYGHFPLESSVISEMVGQRQLGTYTIEQQVAVRATSVLYVGQADDLRACLINCAERVGGANLLFRFYPCKSEDEAYEEARRLKVVFPNARTLPDPD